MPECGWHSRWPRASLDAMADPGTARTTLEIDHDWKGQALPAADRVRLLLERSETDWILEVDAPYYGDPAPPGEGGSTDRLWDYEVVELFLLGEGQRYLEIELGPHGHYLVLLLRGPREPERTDLKIGYQAKLDGDRWYGRAKIPKQLLPGSKPRACNAYAMHGQGADRRYVAAYPVPGVAPDFHRLEFFRALRFE